MNAPQTVEGLAVWDLFQSLTGQVRVSRGLVIGVEMGTAFQIADALGVNKFALAELFPDRVGAGLHRLILLLGGLEQPAHGLPGD